MGKDRERMSNTLESSEGSSQTYTGHEQEGGGREGNEGSRQSFHKITNSNILLIRIRIVIYY